MPQVFGSPFEADAQVSHLVRLGLGDVASTTDSDLYTFRCPLTLYGHLSNSKKQGEMVQLGENCSEEINAMTALEVAWLTCLTVCDYIDRLHGCSINKAIQIVQSWRGKSPEVCDTSPHHTTPYVRTHTRMSHTHLCACQYRQESLQEFERVGKWPKSANQELFRSHTNGATGFYDRFHLAVAAFMAHRVSLLVSISILILVCILFVNNNFNIVITYYL